MDEHKKLVNQLLAFLKKRYGLQNRKTEPFRVLISTILSQRTKDEITKLSTERLFSKYETPEAIGSLREQEIESLIKPAGFYRVKAQRVKEVSKIIVKKFNSKVPDTLDALLSLPGVGRKTANCVLAYGFGIPALPVDTHVHRISNRLGLVKTTNPFETEKSLLRIIPKEYWGPLNTSLVEFGKEICKPIRPRCEECELNKICRYKTADNRFV